MGEIKPCEVCALQGIRISYKDDKEFVSCANDDCLIYDKKIPVEIWQSKKYRAVTNRNKKNNGYKNYVEVKYE